MLITSFRNILASVYEQHRCRVQCLDIPFSGDSNHCHFWTSGILFRLSCAQNCQGHPFQHSQHYGLGNCLIYFSNILHSFRRRLKAPFLKSLVLHFSVLQNRPNRGLFKCSKMCLKKLLNK